MRRLAANRVLLDAATLSLNAVVEIDDEGVVRHVFDLAQCASEPSHTRFYNGLITTFVPPESRVAGALVPELITDALAVGYSGKLLLWQKVSLSSFRITAETVVREL